MRTLFIICFICSSYVLAAQANKKPKMAAIFTPGYYLNTKNDTVRGQVQVNPGDPTAFYREFAFLAGNSKKPKIIRAGQTKAYGFNGKHFVSLNNAGETCFAERLTFGRLRFYEYRYNGKIEGVPSVESAYFIRDAFAGGDDPALKVPRKISHKFYKKALKPYMADQPMLWSDLDKYTFDRDKIVQAINEFNQFYVPTGN